MLSGRVQTLSANNAAIAGHQAFSFVPIAPTAGARAAYATQDEIDVLVALAPPALQNDARWAIPLLIQTGRGGGMTNHRRLAYLLATAHYSAGFGARLDESADPTVDFDRFASDTVAGQAVGNTQPGDAERFCGRGFIFIRGRANYAIWSRRLGLPDCRVEGQTLPYLVADPAAFAQRDIAAQTFVRAMRDGLYSGLGLGQFINAKKTDYYNARRVVGTMDHAREVAELAAANQAAIDDVHAAQHRALMQIATRSAAQATRDVLQEIRAPVERLEASGEPMALPIELFEWNGEARQGKFVQVDERTCALHMGRGAYLRLDINRDLNGIIPPQGKHVVLKRSGDVRLSAQHGEDFWR